MERNCDINMEEAENRIGSLQSMITILADIITKIYKVVSLQWFADMLREELDKKEN